MSDQSAYQEQLLALIRRLTEADGSVSSKERSWLRLLQQEFGAEQAPDAEFDPEVLKSAVQGEDDSEELIQLLLMVSLSDGQTTPREWKLIQEVARIVHISDAHLERLRRETVLAVEP